MKILARRSVVTLTDVSRGQVFSETNLGLKRPGNGLPPIFYEQIIGKKAIRDISKGSRVDFGDFN